METGSPAAVVASGPADPAAWTHGRATERAENNDRRAGCGARYGSGVIREDVAPATTRSHAAPTVTVIA